MHRACLHRQTLSVEKEMTGCRSHYSRSVIQAIGLCALGVVLSVAPRVNAADHGDAPMASNNQSTDIADVFAFLDPNDNDRLILAMTQRGFIAAGENVNFGIFDQFLQYRFQLETTGDARPDQFIDITFSNIAFSPVTGPGRSQTATINYPQGVSSPHRPRLPPSRPLRRTRW